MKQRLQFSKKLLEQQRTRNVDRARNFAVSLDFVHASDVNENEGSEDKTLLYFIELHFGSLEQIRD